MALSATAQNTDTYTVSFDLNYPQAESSVSPLSVAKGRIMAIADKPCPEREGYRFGGWYSSPECNPDQEWFFGKMLKTYFPPEYTDSMAVSKPMTLYARWEAPTHISTAAQFDKIRENLHGWYVLDADIDLSGFGSWQPIGHYTTDYELADGEWWKRAFKGILDGQGHSIKGLKLTDGSYPFNALFGSVANGEIRNLTIDSPTIDITGESVYSAPLVVIVKQDAGKESALRNITVKDVNINAVINSVDPIYSSVTSLAGGVWNGAIEDCHLSGKIGVTVNGNANGELLIGGLMGEGYSETKRCSADLEITANLNASGAMTAQIGGLQASGTDIEGSTARGSIKVSGGNGIKSLFVGGIVGSHRYGTVEGCTSWTDIEISDAPTANVGGILGEFNTTTYGSIGAMSGLEATQAKDCKFLGKASLKNVAKSKLGAVSGVGVPEPIRGWTGSTMAYKIEGCESTIEE